MWVLTSSVKFILDRTKLKHVFFRDMNRTLLGQWGHFCPYFFNRSRIHFIYIFRGREVEVIPEVKDLDADAGQKLVNKLAQDLQMELKNTPLIPSHTHSRTVYMTSQDGTLRWNVFVENDDVIIQIYSNNSLLHNSEITIQYGGEEFSGTLVPVAEGETQVGTEILIQRSRFTSYEENKIVKITAPQQVSEMEVEASAGSASAEVIEVEDKLKEELINKKLDEEWVEQQSNEKPEVIKTAKGSSADGNISWTVKRYADDNIYGYGFEIVFHSSNNLLEGFEISVAYAYEDIEKNAV